MKLWIILTGFILFSLPNISSATYVGCDYVCHTEITWKQIEVITYKKVVRHNNVQDDLDDFFDNLPITGAGYGKGPDMQSKIGHGGELHDCKDYKEWDNIAQDVKNGNSSLYKLVDNKLYSATGKRYLRCNDPDNAFSKYLEKHKGHPTNNQLEEYIPVVQLVWVSFEKWVCELITHHWPPCDPIDPCHPDNPTPVPESPTLALFGIGLLTFIFIYIKRKRDGRQ